MDDDSNTRIRPELSAGAGATRSPAPSIPDSLAEPEAAERADWQPEHARAGTLGSQHKSQGGSMSLQLPTDRPRRTSQLYTIDQVRVKIPTALTKRLRNLSRQQHVSLHATLLSSWAVLLGRWREQEEVLLWTHTFPCSDASGKPWIERTEDIAALRVALKADSTVMQLLKHVDGTLEEARGDRDESGERVVLEGMPLRVLIDLNDAFTAQTALKRKPSQDPSHEATIEFELTLKLTDDDHLRGTLAYAREIFDRQTIERMLDSWNVLLKGMVKHVRRPLSRLPTLTAAERERVLYRFNATTAVYPRGKLIHELFEEHAARAPEALAVEHEGRALTYAELNGRANRLGWYLRTRGVGPDRPVAVCVERGIEMVVSLLAIMKAGGAYLPLDPNYPPERLKQMLEDASPQVLITQEALKSNLVTTPSTELIVLDAVQQVIAEQHASNLAAGEVKTTHDDLVYVIYTSGSTGRPKGVAMAHHSMVNLVEWHRRTFGPGDGTRVLQFAALSFDVAFQEIFSTLCTGGTLVLLDEWVRRDVRALSELLTARSIDRLFVPPLMLQSLAQYAQGAAKVPSLKDVITAGEQLRINPEIVALFSRLSGCRLHNHYGPTETHVVTAFTLSGNASEWPTLPPIGSPIANTQVYVLDGQMRPVPIGVSGEIYLGGAGVARGYLHRPGLTTERFLPDPFSADREARLYKVGDLGRWRTDGTLEYLGRNDDQVKIRGFRVELGEIEAQLGKHPQVGEIAVVAREDAPGQKQLVAYVTPRERETFNVEALRDHLTKLLPEHMVPSAFVTLDRLPLTPSGKLDRRSLPVPAIDAYVRREYEPPRGDMEETLVRIWQNLLKIERVGRHDNFFELGGHSLLIVELLERLRAAGLSVKAQGVYESRTLADLARNLSPRSSLMEQAPTNLIPVGCKAITPSMLPLVELELEHIALIEAGVPGGAGNIQDIYPLAPLQEGILFHHLLTNHGGDTYVLPILLSLSSRERLDVFIAALQQVIDRHDILRTALAWEHLPRPLQIVQRRALVPVEELPIDRRRDIVEQLKEQMEPDRQRLDLRQAPMMRLQVVEDMEGDRWYAVLQLHHLLCDHESLEMMIREVASCIAGRAEELSTPVQYREHVAQALMRVTAPESDAFFRAKLGDVDEPTAPFGLRDVQGGGSRIEECRQILDEELVKRIRSQARRCGASVATLFHVTWALVLSRITGRDDVVFGTVLSGRMQGSAGAQRIMGMFINTLPLRLRLADCSVEELVERTRRELVELMGHEQTSLAAAQRCSGLAGSGPLFSALLNCLQSSLHLETETTEIAPGIQSLELQEWTNYPVALTVDDQGEKFVLRTKTERSVDPARVMTYVRTTLRSLLDALERTPHASALALQVLPERERQQVVEQFNATQFPFPEDKLLHELFEEQVEKTPNAIAVQFEEQSLTYSQLDRRANRLARHLHEKGVRPDQLVAIAIERSIDLLVAVLGVLKAGGAYIPLDTTNPAERLEHVLADAQPQILITLAARRAALPRTTAQMVLLDEEWGEIERQHDGKLDARSLQLEPRHLAYVIYTSGSTGKPKGVMIEHRSIVNYAVHAARAFDVASGGGSLVCTSISFDLMLTGLYPTLLSGRTVRLCPEFQGLPALPDELLRCTDLAPLKLTPSHLSLLEDALESGQLAGRIRTLVLGGEPLRADTVLRWRRHAPGTRLFNHYGPTETTVGCIAHEVTTLTSDTVPLGRPISNTRIYILDDHMRPVPLGVTGEIYIGGAGVARGYWNQSELTAKRFIIDPFNDEPNARLYRSGDLGRWRPDGLIEYLGRNDQQVKIRGFRIELGEIEAQLARHGLVKEAAVVALDDVTGSKRLVAYIVLRDRDGDCEGGGDESPTHAGTLRAHMQGVVPDYMVPSAFVPLPRLPLTPNGKLDRRALPVPELKGAGHRRYEAPLGEVEELVANIWRELLRIERVGRHDNFFELGGHSLLAMQLLVRLRSSFSIDASLRLPFECPVLHQLCTHVEGLREASLLESVEYGGEEIEMLLERVASLPDARVDEMVRELRRERQ